MSDPVSKIQSAYLSLSDAMRNINMAKCQWEDSDWAGCIEEIQWAIDSLESAKAKIYSHNAPAHRDFVGADGCVSCPHCGYVGSPSVEQDEDGYWIECKECGKAFSGILHFDSSGPYAEIQGLHNAAAQRGFVEADGCDLTQTKQGD